MQDHVDATETDHHHEEVTTFATFSHAEPAVEKPTLDSSFTIPIAPTEDPYTTLEEIRPAEEGLSATRQGLTTAKETPSSAPAPSTEPSFSSPPLTTEVEATVCSFSSPSPSTSTASVLPSEWKGESAKEARFRGRCMPDSFHRLLYAATTGNNNTSPLGDLSPSSRRKRIEMEATTAVATIAAAEEEHKMENDKEETLFSPPASLGSGFLSETNDGSEMGCGGYEQPDEAQDVEDMIKGHTDYMDLPEERRRALRESVMELHRRAVELQAKEAKHGPSASVGPSDASTSSSGVLRQLEHHRVRAARLKGFKDTARKSELTAAYQELIREGVLPSTDLLASLLLRKQTKSHSGVLVITVLMGPGKFSCPKDCYYCPQQPGVARSYLLKEPAVLRGFRNGWDPVAQFYDRASALEGNGHVVDKVELIILGGTFSFYPAEYAEQFIGACFYAANTFYPEVKTTSTSSESTTMATDVTSSSSSPRPMRDIATEISLNETARCRIIGVTVETRPDYISARELRRFRHLGVTRVQLGIQHLDDDILTLINRDCPTYKAAEAIERLLNAGFKVDAHWMPDLPGSSFQKDMEMFQLLLDDSLNEQFQVDQWKVYPTATVPYTKIREWYEAGRYKPYAEEEGGKYMTELLLYIMTHAPYRLRLNRIVRDIPTDYIKGGERRVNLRQMIEGEIKKKAATAAEAKPPQQKKCEEENGSHTETRTTSSPSGDGEHSHRKDPSLASLSSPLTDMSGNTLEEERPRTETAGTDVTTEDPLRCRDIRERECKKSVFREEDLSLFIDHHRASGGTEYYISMENKDRTQLYGHLRLRIRDAVHDPDQSDCLFPVLQHAALIRELHTYGTLVAVHGNPSTSTSPDASNTTEKTASQATSSSSSSPSLFGAEKKVHDEVTHAPEQKTTPQRTEEAGGVRIGMVSEETILHEEEDEVKRPHIMTSTKEKDVPRTAAQHRGIGTRLMHEAEELAYQKYGLTKYVVIAGIGARPYYAKLGYHLEDTYMVKYRDTTSEKEKEEEGSMLHTQKASLEKNEEEEEEERHREQFFTSSLVPLSSPFPFSLLDAWNDVSTSVRSFSKKLGATVKGWLAGRKRDRAE